MLEADDLGTHSWPSRGDRQQAHRSAGQTGLERPEGAAPGLDRRPVLVDADRPGRRPRERATPKTDADDRARVRSHQAQPTDHQIPPKRPNRRCAPSGDYLRQPTTSGDETSWLRALPLLSGRGSSVLADRVMGLLGERRLGRPCLSWAVSPTKPLWRPLRLARLCREHEFVLVVRPPVSHITVFSSEGRPSCGLSV
jgi:hypothetical protein